MNKFFGLLLSVLLIVVASATQVNQRETILNKLRNINTNLANQVAQTLPDNCELEAIDLVFLVDESGSVGEENFDLLKQFIIAVGEAFELGPTKARAALLRFRTMITPGWSLESSTANSNAEFEAAVGNLVFAEGSTSGTLTNTGDAFKYALDNYLPERRMDVKTVVILLTDGNPTEGDENYPTATSGPLYQVCKSHTERFWGVCQYALAESDKIEALVPEVAIVSFGIGNVSDEFLEYVNTKPGPPLVIDSFDVIFEYVTILVNLVLDCTTDVPTKNPTVAPSIAPSGCTPDIADIIMVLDTSGSIKDESFQQMINFADAFAEDFTLGPDATRIGLLTFASDVKVYHGLDDAASTNESLFKASLATVKHTNGVTNDAKAFAAIRDSPLFLQSSSRAPGGPRADVPAIMVLITDGRPNRPMNAGTVDKVYAADVAINRATSIRDIPKNSIMALGIQDNQIAEFLEQVSDEYMVIGSFNALEDSEVLAEFLDISCEQISEKKNE